MWLFPLNPSSLQSNSIWAVIKGENQTLCFLLRGSLGGLFFTQDRKTRKPLEPEKMQWLTLFCVCQLSVVSYGQISVTESRTSCGSTLGKGKMITQELNKWRQILALTHSRCQACSHTDLWGKNFNIICYSHLVAQLIIQELRNPQKGHLFPEGGYSLMWAI